MGFGFMGFGMLFMAVFWIGIILLAVWAVREFLPRSQATNGSASALDIAKARYARGEISKAEFEELKKGLV
ncbi:MAG: SHOCT domain-containing protein [Chloroflexi bacterium]|nr:SHOCT domain-containing protein [Chloroflexota bacterium]